MGFKLNTDEDGDSQMAGESSPEPKLEMQSLIQKGLQQCQKSQSAVIAGKRGRPRNSSNAKDIFAPEIKKQKSEDCLNEQLQ